MAKSPAWQRAEGKNPKGGLNAKGRASAKAQGMNLKPPVKKAEAAKSPKSAGRRKSFCGRMCGMKAKNTSSKTAKDPNSRINKSLRAWDCSCKWKRKLHSGIRRILIRSQHLWHLPKKQQQRQRLKQQGDHTQTWLITLQLKKPRRSKET